MDALIGTSGFSYREWRNTFYPAGMKPPEHLAFYASKFPTVEINMTFYRPVAEETLFKWKASVPKDFLFTMKAGKVITHYKRLRRCTQDLKDMWKQFAPLGDQLSCVLFQLPPSLKPNYELLEEFLEEVRATQRRAGIECRVAVEFRSRLWYEDPTFAIMDRYEMATVLHDMPYRGGFWPIEQDGEILLKSGHLIIHPDDWLAKTNKNFSYFRFHGTVDKQAWQRYGIANLEPWAMIAKRALEHGKPFYGYFNNDGNGAAPGDAELFASLLAREE